MHRRALFRVKAAADGLQRRLQLPAPEDVDTPGGDQVRADRDAGAEQVPVQDTVQRGPVKSGGR